MSTINQCPTLFCGCQSIHSQCFLTSTCPPGTFEQSSGLELSYRVYMNLLFMVVIVMLFTKVSLQWFIYKDYYPLKEKSPILTIIMSFSICVQLMIYPFVYTFNYFTYIFVLPHARMYFRAVQVALEFSVYTIYFVRCMRISYAHQIDKSRRKSIPFWIFQRQNVLGLFIILVAILRGVVVGVDPCHSDARCTDFAFGFEIASVNDENQTQQYFMMRSLISSFFWQILLFFCMWLHRNVNYRYSMNKQFFIISACTQLTSLIHIFTISSAINSNEKSIMLHLCGLSNIYPMTEFLKLMNLLIAFVVSVIVPLFQKKVYHVLLPTGPHYGFVKTMRNFLMEKQFLRVFSAYLEYLDQQEHVESYTKLLKFWQQMVILKISNQKQTENDKLESIITLVEQVQQTSFFREYNELISNLKGTISGLQDSQIESQNSQPQSQQHTLSISQEIRREKYRSSINDRVDELEEIALQKLNKIYAEKYIHTESYFYLREIMNQYKKVNLNLIMLNMALIVDNDNEFS